MDLKLKNNSLLSIANNSYIPIKYVESIGSPNIDTGVNFYYSTRNLKIDCVLEVVENSAAGSLIFAANVETCRTYLSCINADDTTSFSMRYYESTSQAEALFQATGKIHIIASERYLNVNGTTYTLDAVAVARGTNLRLLPSDTVKVRIYSFKIYQSNTLIRNFIPAISYQYGHFGEACLYDTVNNVFYYSASIGSFSISGSIYNNIEKVFIQNCPNVSAINILRRSPNLTNVRCDIGTVYGPLSEVQHYATLHGFNANEEPDDTLPPTINGTFTVTSWYTTAEIQELENVITGLTIETYPSHNIDSAFSNELFAVQTIDSTKPGYNPAVAIILEANGHGSYVDSGNIHKGWLITKEQASAVMSFNRMFNGKSNVLDSKGIVSSNTSLTYRFTNFDEIVHFFSVHSLATGEFAGSSLVNIKLPSNINTFAANNADVFRSCQYLDNIYCMSDRTYVPRDFTDMGYADAWQLYNNANGILYINGNYTVNTGTKLRVKKFLIKGNLSKADQSYVNYVMFAANIYNGDTYYWQHLEVFRIGGNIAFWAGWSVLDSNYYMKFIECMGTIHSASGHLIPVNSTNTIVHLGYHSIAGSYGHFNQRQSHASKIYVGSGVSRSDDQTTLDTYLADADWSTNLSSKLAIWYDYNGIYKWYYVTDNLTNCINTNPDDWPHITRGDSYHTVIEAYDGYTLNSVTVQMYEAVDDGTTPNTPTDITSSVYNSSTGEINIPSVTGNVIITASAS